MKQKLFLLFILLFIFTGCSANYDIEIYNNQIKENMNFVNNVPSSWHQEFQYGISFSDLIDASYKYPYPVFFNTVVDENDTIKLEGIEYYDNTLISTSNELGLQLKYNKFTLQNFSNSLIANKCYQYFRVIEQNNEIIFSTSVENTCFNTYSNLDEIVVNLKTNHKVVSSNADIVDGYHYTWNLDRDNKDDSAILLTIKKDEYIFNYENEFTNKVIYIAVIVGIILGISGITYLYFKKKRESSNKL